MASSSQKCKVAWGNAITHHQYYPIRNSYIFLNKIGLKIGNGYNHKILF